MPLFLGSLFLAAAVTLILLDHVNLLWFLAGLAALTLMSRLRYFLILPLGVYALVASDEASKLLGIDIAVLARLTKWLGIAAVLLLVLRGFLARAFNLPHPSALWCVAFGLWGGMTLLWSVDPLRSEDVLVTVFGLILLSVALSMNRLSDAELAFLREMIVVGGALVAVSGLYAYFSGQFQFGEFERSLVPRLGGEIGARWSVNPNQLTASMFLPFSLSLAGIFTSRPLGHRVWSYAAFTAMTFAAVFAQSRAGLIGMIVVLLLVTWRLKRIRLGVWVILAAVALPGSEVLEALLSRFTGEQFWSGSGRREIWAAGLESLGSSWTVGAGLGTFHTLHKSDAHNTYLQIGVELGILGLVLFLGAMLSLLKGLRQINAQEPGPIPAVFLEASLIGLLSYGFFGALLVEKFFWLAVGLAMLVILQDAALARAEKAEGEMPPMVVLAERWER